LARSERWEAKGGESDEEWKDDVDSCRNMPLYTHVERKRGMPDGMAAGYAIDHT
jgi:hypothetical protein